jgi:uncharacterized protein (TIGR00251 family)
MAFYRWEDDKLHLFIKVQPKASKDEFADVLADPLCERIKIRITAPPVDGKANKHLIKYLSKVFKVAKSAIIIKNGETGRAKHLIINSPAQLPKQITLS